MSMKPKHFKRGDPFSARHMNDIIGEARGARSVRASNDGFVNDPQGNRVFNTAPPGVRLAVAIEDFAVQEQPTDFRDKVDTVPSGKCLMLRLNSEADYIEETRSRPFRAYDPIAHLNGSGSQATGNAFHVVWNSDSKRWEVIAPASSVTKWGIVDTVQGCGMYVIELGVMCNQESSASISVSGSLSDPTPCDPCDNVISESTENCGIELFYPPNRVTGTGVFVTAYHPASVLVPLVVGSDCIVAKVSNTAMSGSGSSASNIVDPCGSESTSISGSDPVEEVWGVMSGTQEHIVQYKERGECCPTTGEWVTTHKTPIILIGKECDEITCDECPTSGSSS